MEKKEKVGGKKEKEHGGEGNHVSAVLECDVIPNRNDVINGRPMREDVSIE